MQPRATTSEDIRRINAILQPKPGDIIPWAALEEILAPVTRHDRRFRTIYRAWIAHMRKWHNRKVVALRGIGLRVMLEYERLGDVRRGMERTWTVVERVKQDVDDVQLVDLTAGQVMEAGHVRFIVHRVQRALADERSKLQQIPLAPLPAEPPLPQRAAVSVGA